MSAMDDVNRQHLAMAGVDPDTLGKPQEKPLEPDRCVSLQGEGLNRCALKEGHQGRHVRGTVSWDERVPERHMTREEFDRERLSPVEGLTGCRAKSPAYQAPCSLVDGHEGHHKTDTRALGLNQVNELWPNTYKQREGDQPLPVINDHPDIQSAVIADIEARRELGIQRYGTALQPNNGRDMLLDAYDEAIDLAIYLKGAIVERDLREQS
jgi:hypothetical protein